MHDYIHRVEYRREKSKYERELLYTEFADDHGFNFTRKGVTRKQWREFYTQVCAADYLERQSAPKGRYLISVFRGDECICSVRMPWPLPAEPTLK